MNIEIPLSGNELTDKKYKSVKTPLVQELPLIS